MRKPEPSAHAIEIQRYLLFLRAFMDRLRFEKADRLRAKQKKIASLEAR